MPTFTTGRSGTRVWLYDNPAIPTVWDPNWPNYVDLTTAQVAAFEAFPQDLIRYAGTIRWYYEIRSFPQSSSMPNPYITVAGITVVTNTDNLTKITALALDAQLNNADTYSITVNGTVFNLNATQAIALFNGVRAYVQQCRNIEAQMINGINANTITSRSQIDTAFAVLN